MVAKIKSGRSLIGALNYNEHKVQNNKAQLIEASGYFKDLHDLSLHDKLLRLTDLAGRNERTKVNAVHISLNFAINENLETVILNEIAADYMEKIGFANQPYLVYKHIDAGHPHMHIVTTNIKPSGERIGLNLLGKTKSSEARKAIEIKYGLVKTGEQNARQERLERLQLSKVNYGKTESKRAITNVVNEVVRSYKFTSIPELNAVLNRYNITADRGAKDSRMYEKKGLVYWIMDKEGNKLGVPIKASSIYGKPTLKTSEDRFRLNEVLRKPQKQELIKLIDSVFSKPVSKAEFQDRLLEKGVQTIFRHNDDGRLYGVTFVDHGTKTVFNGSDLGRGYSANVLTQKLAESGTITADLVANGGFASRANEKSNDTISPDDSHHIHSNSIIDAIFKEEQIDMAAIGKLQQRKRKKKRKGRSL